MSIVFTPKLQSAISFAAESHRNQTRKNENQTPYIMHPFSVMLIASEYTEVEETLITCLLHDVVEDCGVAFEEIEEIFGIEVKDNVYHLSEPKFFGSPDNTLSWKERKDNYLALLQVASKEALLAASCDKIHNMSTINRDLINKGTFWFLDSVLEILENRKSELPENLITKYKNTLDKIKSEFAVEV